MSENNEVPTEEDQDTVKNKTAFFSQNSDFHPRNVYLQLRILKKRHLNFFVQGPLTSLQ